MGPPRKSPTASGNKSADADAVDPQQILTWAKRRYPELADDLERLWRTTTPTTPYKKPTRS